MSAAPNPHGSPTPTHLEPFPPPEAEDDSAASHKLRADAARNRERVIAAATKAFASEGIDVSMEAIASAPASGWRRSTGSSRRKSRSSSQSSRTSWPRYARLPAGSRRRRTPARRCTSSSAAFETVSSKHVISPKPSNVPGRNRSRVPRSSRCGGRRSRSLVERAKSEGAVRSDVEVDEVLYLVSGTCSAVMNHAPEHGTRTRMARVICDGLRPD